MAARGAVGVLVLVATMTFAAAAHAATIEVETDGDEFGAGGPCALREAVEAARTNAAFGGCPKGSASKRDTIVMPADAVLTIHGDTATNADGDLDYDGGGKLTIRGTDQPDPDPPKITGDFTDRILEVTHQKGVRVEGVQMEGGGGVNSGAAVRASTGSSLTLENVNLHDNVANLRGGAVACEGCKSLALTGAFHIDDNAVQSSTSAEGGGIWSNAPTKLTGIAGGPIPFLDAQITENRTNPTGIQLGQGAGIFASDDLTITDTYFSGNDAEDSGSGGALALAAPPGGAKLKLIDSTLQGNTAANSGAGIAMIGTDAVLDVRRSAIIQNDSTGSANGGSAFGAGVFLDEGGGKITDSVIDGNTATATAAGNTAAGGGIFTSTESSQPTTLKLNRTSVTNNSVAVGTANQRGGGLVIQGRLETLNSTIAGNTAPASGADGGGIKIERSGGGVPSARFDFTTIKGNVGDVGDGLVTEGNVAIRASVIDQAGDACVETATGLMHSKGFNVEEGDNAGCEIDAATDSHGNDFLLFLDENGSPPAGTTDEIAQTAALINPVSAALDIVPPQNCKVDATELKVDARGAPRPAEDGCEAGAMERVSCFDAFLFGPHSFVGTKGADQIQGSNADADVVLAQGGDDTIQTYGGADTICAGKGNDLVQPQAGNDEIDAGKGTDMLNYNNAMPGGLSIFLAEESADGVSIGVDSVKGFENAQGSEDDDHVEGDNRDNLLIGGGGVDELLGKGGIDVLDAKDGEADAEINCGPGKNSKEKAKIDEGLDPEPKSC